MFEQFPFLHGTSFTYQQYYGIDGACVGILVAALSCGVSATDAKLTSLMQSNRRARVDKVSGGPDGTEDGLGEGLNVGMASEEEDGPRVEPESGTTQASAEPAGNAALIGAALAWTLAGLVSLGLIVSMLFMSATFQLFWIVLAIFTPLTVGLLQLADCTSSTPLAVFASSVRSGLHWFACGWLSFSLMMLPMWFAWSTLMGGLLAWFPWVGMRLLRLLGLCGAPVVQGKKVSVQLGQPLRIQLLAVAKEHPVIPLSLVLALFGCWSVAYATQGTCLGLYSPDASGFLHFSVILWSSRASRAWAGLAQCGADDPSKPCHVYLTTAEDMATQVFVNVHTALEAPDLYVQVCASQDCSVIRSEDRHTMARFDLDEGENLRTVHTALLTSLTPGATVAFLVSADGENGEWSDTSVRWLRTMGADGSTPATVALGGDTGVNEWGTAVNRHVAAQDVDWAMVGGDVAYTNGFAECYQMWDTWIDIWERTMIGPDGNMIPLSKSPQ
eukprot:COSAG02_NODE_170_length_31534_cov_33.568498_9_plen_500_part_00